MHKTRNRRGFSLAETLAVVGILIALLAVVFVMVINYQRSIAQLERDGIAKEIFVAAQNHLTYAESQGYLGRSDYGIPEEDSAVHYYVVNSGSVFPTPNRNTDGHYSVSDPKSLIGLMLPFASVDETVRMGGNYIVRYQAQPPLVLDVFYTTVKGTRFGHDFSSGEYSSILDLRDTADANKKQQRRSYGADKSVIGWYGGAELDGLEKLTLGAPTIEVINGDQLKVLISDPNGALASDKYSLKLIIEGVLSEAQTSFTLDRQSLDRIRYDAGSNSYEVMLDDITAAGMSFSQIESENSIRFIPGENIRIRAVAYSTSNLANVAYSAEKTTNSLYADGTDTSTAQISSIRHLENLDKIISNLDANDSNDLLNIGAAVQTTDLDWESFSGGTKCIYRPVGPISGAATQPDNYYPINPSYPLNYDGQGHSISGIRAEQEANAGLFGSIVGGSSISKLQLIDFCVSSSGYNAGALIAEMPTNTSVRNVVAFNSQARDGSFSAASPNVSSATHSAGGLIGNVSGGCLVENCASALWVSGYEYAGGLIGVSAGSVRNCYSGGHTNEGEYYTHSGGARGAAIYNVVSASGVAGGLIGDAGGSSVSNCYSTCSVQGNTAGGFIGKAEEGKIANSYCTGLVGASGTNPSTGAFLGSGTLHDDSTGNKYLEIINELVTRNANNEVTAITYLGPGTTTGISAMDASGAAFNSFVGATRDDASPYDDELLKLYQGKYSFPSIKQLDPSLPAGSFVGVHYGDWPAPETLIVNTPETTAP